jgi:dihydroflavonol-4-reductase
MTQFSLVTGGSGFIGRHLVSLLASNGDKVRVLDLREWPEAPSGVEARRGSILDRGTLDRAMAGVDRVFHLAGNPNLWAPDPQSFHDVNYQGTCRVLEAAAKAGVTRIVYTSTESILKNMRAPRDSQAILIDETASLTVDDVPGPYCRSKFMAEEAAKRAADTGLPVVIVNPTMPIGPGDVLLTPPTKMILGFLNGTIPAYLNCEFNLVDARDAAVGHLQAAEKGRVGERYILGGTNLSLGALLERLRALTGLPMTRTRVPYAVAYAAAMVSESLANIRKQPPMAPLTGVRLARSSMAFDSRKARAELDWTSRSLDQSLLDTISDLKRRGLLLRDVSLATRAA